MSYNGKYAYAPEGAIIRIDTRPYYDDAGLSIGWLPIVDVPPAYDPDTHKIEQQPQASWTIGAESVAVTYNVVALTPAEIAAQRLSAVPIDTLEVTEWTIPADGATYVVCRYYATDTVHFVVDGEVVTVEPDEFYAAELSIAADAPGAITIQARKQQAVIVAEEVV